MIGPPVQPRTPDSILAGFSKVDITPPLELMEVFGLGYWYKRAIRFRGVRDPLFARALALGEGSDCQLFISVDALLDTYNFIPRAQELIQESLGLSPAGVFITCTHTHSAPVVRFNRVDNGSEYGPFLVSRILTAAAEALENRSPMVATLRRGSVAGLLRNRRVLLRSGKIAELHVPIDPAEIADSGPVNDVLTLVEYRRSSGSLAGALCHFGIHGVSIQCSELISSDCMGRAIQQIESEGNSVILHLNAPCADIDPILMGDDTALEEMTRRLYAGIRGVSKATGQGLRVSPQRSSRVVFRAARRGTRKEEELSLDEERLDALSADTNLNHHSGAGYERFLIEEERRVAAMPAQFDIPYQILRAGDLLWIGVGGEIFTRFGQRLAAADKGSTVLPVGITGASAGYLPGIEMFAQGGYEVATATWCPIAPGESERLFQLIEEDVRRLMGAAQ
jgi:neutral ceramidase